jgi:hypothetical protein
MADEKRLLGSDSGGNVKIENHTNGSPTKRKMLVMAIAVLYFIVGFFVLVVLLGEFIGSNYAGFVALAYLVAGWYFLVRKRTLLRFARR